MAPKSQLNGPIRTVLGHLNALFGCHLIDFCWPFSGGAKMVLFRLRNALSGIPGFRALYGARTIAKIQAPQSTVSKLGAL